MPSTTSTTSETSHLSRGVALSRLLEVLDKGKAASVTAIVHTTDKRTGEVIFENQTTLVVRGSGGFGGKRIGNGQ